MGTWFDGRGCARTHGLMLGLALIGISAAGRTAPIEVQAGGPSVRAGDDGVVDALDRAGQLLMKFTDYKLVWSPQRTKGGAASRVTLPDGRTALQVDYGVDGDPTGKSRIRSQFIPSAQGIHVRFDLWLPAGIETAGAMVGRRAGTGFVEQPCSRLSHWVRHEHGGVPYEVSDGIAFSWTSSNATVVLVFAKTNEQWRDPWSQSCQPVAAEPGHWTADLDLLALPAGAPVQAAAAGLQGRPLVVNLGTDRVFNLWDGADKALPLRSQVTNASADRRDVEISYWARNFGGQIVQHGTEKRNLRSGETWNKTIAIPAPQRGIIFVELDARSGAEAAFARTNLAVLPAHAFQSGPESIFGLSAYFPVPTEQDAELLMQRMGVRWLRSIHLSPNRARSLGISQNDHIDAPGGDIHAMKDDPVKKEQWIREKLDLGARNGAVYLEFGNEWNMKDWKADAQENGPAAQAYVKEWLTPIAKVRQETGSKVKILSMGLAGMDERFMDRVHQLGGWDLFDAFALHPGRGNYTADYGVPSDGDSTLVDSWNYLGAIRKAKKMLARYGQKPLFLTEAYACTQPNNWWVDSYRHAAENVVLSYALALAEGVRCVEWYQLNDTVWYDIGGCNPKDGEYHYGLLNRDLSPKPSLLAYYTIAEALDQATFVRWMKFSDPLARGLLFGTPRGHMAILWYRADGYVLTKKSETYASPEAWVDEWKTKVPMDLPASGANLRVLDCIGRETNVSAVGGKARIILTGAPLIVYGLDDKAGG